MKKVMFMVLAVIGVASLTFAASTTGTLSTNSNGKIVATYTNAMGVVVDVVVGSTGDESELVTLESNANSDAIPVGYMYLTSAAAVTNVSFSATYPGGEDVTMINLGTNNITIVDSATCILGTNLTLGTEDSVHFHCVSDDTLIKVGGEDLN